MNRTIVSFVGTWVLSLALSAAESTSNNQSLVENTEPAKTGQCAIFKEWTEGSSQFRERCQPDVRDTCTNGECPGAVTKCIDIDPTWEYVEWRPENDSRNPKKSFTAPSDDVNSWSIDTRTNISGKVVQVCLSVDSKRNWGGGKRGWIAADFIVKMKKPPSSNTK